MASEIRDVAKTSNIVTDLGTINNSYADAVLYDDPIRTSGNIFLWTATATANNATVYAGSSGFWVMQFNGRVQLDWFGPKADLVSDDSAIINTALTFCSGKYGLDFNGSSIYLCNISIAAAIDLDGNNATVKPYSNTAIITVTTTGNYKEIRNLQLNYGSISTSWTTADGI